MFLDLNVAWDPRRAPALVELALRFGFAGIAHTVTIQGAQLAASKMNPCPISPCRLPASSERCGPLSRSLASDLGLGEGHDVILQLRRLTVVVSDSTQLAAVGQMKRTGDGYHLIAVRPVTGDAFDLACERGECDVISLALDEKLPFILRQKSIHTFLARDGYFEIEFAPALRDGSRRRCLLANAEQLLHATRGKNVFISSAARDPMEMRSPNDLQNFAAVAGMRGALARQGVGAVPYRALQRNALRRGGCVKIMDMPAADVEMEDKEPAGSAR